MSVITKLEAFKWRSLPSDTTQPLHANEDDGDHKPLSFDDLAARVWREGREFGHNVTAVWAEAV